MSKIPMVTRCALALSVLALASEPFVTSSFAQVGCANPPCDAFDTSKAPPMPTTCSGIANPAAQLKCLDMFCSTLPNNVTPYCKYYLDKKNSESKKRENKKARNTGQYESERNAEMEAGWQKSFGNRQSRLNLDNGNPNSAVDGDDRSAPKPVSRPITTGLDLPEKRQPATPHQATGAELIQ